MMNIDIERLIDAVAACNEAYNEYCKSAKNLYKGPFETITERKNHVNYAREVSDRENSSVSTLIEVFNLDQGSTGEVIQCSACRESLAKRYQLGATYPGHYARTDPPVYIRRACRPNFTCERCGCWQA